MGIGITDPSTAADLATPEGAPRPWWYLVASAVDGLLQIAVFVYLFKALRREVPWVWAEWAPWAERATALFPFLDRPTRGVFDRFVGREVIWR